MTSKVTQKSEDKFHKTNSVSQTSNKAVKAIGSVSRLSVENEIEKILPPTDPMPTVPSPEVKDTRTSTTTPDETPNTAVSPLSVDLEPPGRIIGEIIQHCRSTPRKRESIGVLTTPAPLSTVGSQHRDQSKEMISSQSSINLLSSPIPADPSSLIWPTEAARDEYEFAVVERLDVPLEPPIDYINNKKENLDNLLDNFAQQSQVSLNDVGCQTTSISSQTLIKVELNKTSNAINDSKVDQSQDQSQSQSQDQSISTRTTIAQSINTESTLTTTSIGYRSIDSKRFEKMQKVNRKAQKSFKKNAIRQRNQLEDKYAKEKEANRMGSKKRRKELENDKLMEFENVRSEQRKAYPIVQAKLKSKMEREIAKFRSTEASQLKKIENGVKNLPKAMQKDTLKARISQLKRERREEEQLLVQRFQRKTDLLMRKLAESDQNAISKIEQKYMAKAIKQKKKDKEIEEKRVERMRKDKFDLNVKLLKSKLEMLEAQLDCAQHKEVKRLEKKQTKRIKISMFFNLFRQSSKFEENRASELQELKERHRIEKREFEKKKNRKLDQLYETQTSGDNFSLFDDSDEETIVENDYTNLSKTSLNTWRL